MSSPWEAPQSPAESPPPAGPGIPWETEQSFGSLVETMKRLLLEPAQTFQVAVPDLSMTSAFLFAMILSTAGGLLAMGPQLMLGGGFAERLPEQLEWLKSFSTPGLGSLVSIPVGAAIGLFIEAGVVHLLLMMLGGANRSFETTVRAVAFTNGSTALFQVVPVLGSLVALVWGLIIQAHGLKEMHQTSMGKALGAVLIPIGLCVFCLGAVGIMAAGALAQYFNK